MRSKMILQPNHFPEGWCRGLGLTQRCLGNRKAYSASVPDPLIWRAATGHSRKGLPQAPGCRKLSGRIEEENRRYGLFCQQYLGKKFSLKAPASLDQFREFSRFSLGNCCQIASTVKQLVSHIFVSPRSPEHSKFDEAVQPSTLKGTKPKPCSTRSLFPYTRASQMTEKAACLLDVSC